MFFSFSPFCQLQPSMELPVSLWHSGSVGHTGSTCSNFLNVTPIFVANGFFLSLICLMYPVVTLAV